MAVGPFKALTEDTTTILTSVYDDLIRQSEQLRIIKNCIENDMFYSGDLKSIIKAMESKEIIEHIADNKVINTQEEEPANE